MSGTPLGGGSLGGGGGSGALAPLAVLTGGPMLFTNPTVRARALVTEWLTFWFDGNDHQIGGLVENFPRCDIRWDQDPVANQPLCTEIRGHCDPRRVKHCPSGEAGVWIVEAVVSFEFMVRIGRAQSEKANYEANRIADLLWAILDHPDGTQALSRQGITELRPGTPLTLASEPFKLRAVRSPAKLRFELS